MTDRFDHLSVSESGLHYVRDKRARITRVLTDSELQDFNDPPPCPECAEQFGCEHFNCAGEPLLAEDELQENVPNQWMPFAKDYGLSRGDLERLRLVEEHEGEWRVAGGASADMRTLEIVLLLNEAR